MIVVRFKVQCQPDKAGELHAAFSKVIAPSRAVEGVLHFDIAQDIADPSAFVATEVFADREALTRQESLPEVQQVMTLLPNVLAAAPEATVYDVASSTPWGE